MGSTLYIEKAAEAAKTRLLLRIGERRKALNLYKDMVQLVDLPAGHTWHDIADIIAVMEAEQNEDLKMLGRLQIQL